MEKIIDNIVNNEDKLIVKALCFVISLIASIGIVGGLIYGMSKMIPGIVN